MFPIFFIIALCLIISIFFLILRSISRSDKSALAFLNDVSDIIGGRVSEHKFAGYRISLSGTYKGKEIHCTYIRRGGETDDFPTILFGLKPLSVPKIKKRFLFWHPKITDKVILKKDLLIYKHILSSQLESTQELFNKIFDVLVQAEERLGREGVNL